MPATDPVIVTTSAELEAALAAATGGETILLRNTGEPFALRTGATPASEVVVRSENPDDPAVVHTISLVGARNITIADIVVESGAEGTARPSTVKDILISESSDIRILDSHMRSTADGLRGGLEPHTVGESLMDIRRSSNVEIAGNLIENYKYGIAIIEENVGITVRGNEIRALQGDAIRITGGKTILIEDNHIHDFLGSTKNLNHMDMIQVWNVGTTPPTDGLTIRNNLLLAGTGVGTQSIFINNERGRVGDLDTYLKNIVIEGNVVHNGHVNGIYVHLADGVRIANNTVLTNDETPMQDTATTQAAVTAPRIWVHGSARGVEIVDNIGSVSTSAAGAVLSGNVAPDYGSRSSAFWPADNFLYFDEAPRLGAVGLKLAPDGALAALGIGAGASVLDLAPSALTPVFTVERVWGTHDSFVFDAGWSADAGGLLDPATVLYTWSFGGVTASGPTVTHRFEALGWYDVTLTVTTAAETASFTAPVLVGDPELFDLGFSATAIADLDGRAIRIDYDPARIALDSADGLTGYALSQDNGFTLNRVNTELYNLDSFTLELTIRRDDADAGGGGLLRLHKSFSLTLENGGELVFGLDTATGTPVQLRTLGAGLDDTDWHHVAAVYDAASGRMAVYVDGVLAGSAAAEGLTSGPQSWGLSVGNPFGTNFEGLIGDLRMHMLPFGAEEAAAAHAELRLALGEPVDPSPDPDPVPDPDPEPDPGTDPEPGTDPARTVHEVRSYQPRTQDVGFAEVAADGGSVRVGGNGWKQIDAAGRIEADTILFLDVAIESLGEIHAIGFETDDAESPERFFQLDGTQVWGVQAFNGLARGDGFQSIALEIGRHFTGDFDRIVLVSDDDRRAGGVTSFGTIALGRGSDADSAVIESVFAFLPPDPAF